MTAQFIVPAPVEPKLSTCVDVPPPIGCAVNMVVEPEAGVVAVTAVGIPAGHVAVDVKGANAAPAGVAVCAQETIAVVTTAPGVQLTPMAGAFAPTVAGPVIVRLAPTVIA